MFPSSSHLTCKRADCRSIDSRALSRCSGERRVLSPLLACREVRLALFTKDMFMLLEPNEDKVLDCIPLVCICRLGSRTMLVSTVEDEKVEDEIVLTYARLDVVACLG